MWEISVNSQILTVLYSVLFGAVLSLVFDFMTAAVKGFSRSGAALFVSDILFWILSGFAVFMFLIARTNGEIRGFVIMSSAIGFLVYRATLRMIIFPFLFSLFSFLCKLYTSVAGALAGFCSSFERILNVFAAKIRKISANSVNKMKKLLKNAVGMLYTDKNGKKSE